MTTLVKCPNPLCGFRFPVNLKKHLHRRTRFCPRCHTEIPVRRRFKFLPNPKWNQQKEEAQAFRERIKAMRGKIEPTPMPIAMASKELLALSLAILKREKELEEAQKR